MTPHQENESHFWSTGSLSCRLPRGLYSTALSVWNGVNNQELFGPVYHMDTGDTVESNVASNVPSYFPPIVESSS